MGLNEGIQVEEVTACLLCGKQGEQVYNGPPGAAGAWTLRVFFDFTLLLIAACRVTSAPLRLLAGRATGLAALGPATMAAAFYLFHRLTGGALGQFIFTPLLVGAFSTISWLFILDPEEKVQIRSWLRVAC